MILQLSQLEARTGLSSAPKAACRIRLVRGGLALFIEAKMEKNLQTRARFSLLLSRAVEQNYLLGDELAEQYQILRNWEHLSQAATYLEALQTRIQALEASAQEPVSLHGEADLRYARFAFKYLRAEDYAHLGLEAPAEPSDFTRLGARRAVAYLYEQRAAREAA